MKCLEFVQSMFEFCRGELSPDEMALCHDHLTSCEQCQQELRDTETCFSMMKACCGIEKMPESLEKKLRELIVGCCGPRK